MMKIVINPAYESLRGWLEQLPECFARGEGELLRDARNTIRAFEVGGLHLVVKKHRRPGWFNTMVYSFLRKSKAQRAYEHALRLREQGFDSPEPVAWCESRAGRLLRDAYYVSVFTADSSLMEAAQLFPATDSQPLLAAFARYAARLHEAGIEHEDFNCTNILYHPDCAAADGFCFQLIDINRMSFHRRPLSQRRCMVNLRRLACPGAAFLYILDRYAETRCWNIDQTMLAGTFFRLLFGRRNEMKRRFREKITRKR